MEKILTIIALFAVGFAIVYRFKQYLYTAKEGSLAREVKSDFIWDKDLSYSKTEKFSVFDVKLYNFTKNTDGSIDQSTDVYKSVLKLVAKHMKVDLKEGLLLDESDKDYMDDYITIMTYCTNFRFDVFSFKNNNVKIVDFENNKIKGITDHIDNIISTVFYLEYENMKSGKYN